MDTVDLAVIGLGALGIHVAAEAASRGLSVAGFESHTAAHEFGATAGRTRIFRTAYTFGSAYVPALVESRAAWAALDSRHPGEVWSPHGALMIGDPADLEMAAVIVSAQEHGVEHTIFDPQEIRSRFPQHRPRETDVGVFDATGALLLPQSITALVSTEAVAAGATLHYGATVDELRPVAGGTEVATSDGATITARNVVVATGAWTSHLVPEYAQAVQLRRVVLQWYPTDDHSRFTPDVFPVGLRRSDELVRFSFFPQVDDRGIKVNFHIPKLVLDDADQSVNPVPAEYAERLSHLVPEVFDGVGATASATVGYVESYTDDFRILLDRAPGRDGVWVLGGGSGQAFKLSPVLARYAVDRVLGADSDTTGNQLDLITRGFTAATVTA
jgi:sarcosine oxidase